jgi:NAD(P)H-flavin reductase
MKIEKKISKLVNKSRLTESYWWFELEFEKEYVFEAGQYVSVKVNNKGERRAYSIATRPSGSKKIGLLIKMVPNGLGSDFFNNLEIGDEVEVLGPMGRFVLSEDRGNEKKMIFVATGSGIAPLKSMIEDCLLSKKDKESVHLIWGLRNEQEVFWQKEFIELERKFKNFKFDLMLSRNGDDWKGNIGRVTDVLGGIENFIGSEFYLCGSDLMVEDCRKILKNMGVKREDIYFEKYE